MTRTVAIGLDGCPGTSSTRCSRPASCRTSRRCATAARTACSRARSPSSRARRGSSFATGRVARRARRLRLHDAARGRPAERRPPDRPAAHDVLRAARRTRASRSVLVNLPLDQDGCDGAVIVNSWLTDDDAAPHPADRAARALPAAARRLPHASRSNPRDVDELLRDRAGPLRPRPRALPGRDVGPLLRASSRRPTGSATACTGLLPARRPTRRVDAALAALPRARRLRRLVRRARARRDRRSSSPTTGRARRTPSSAVERGAARARPRRGRRAEPRRGRPVLRRAAGQARRCCGAARRSAASARTRCPARRRCAPSGCCAAAWTWRSRASATPSTARASRAFSPDRRVVRDLPARRRPTATSSGSARRSSSVELHDGRPAIDEVWTAEELYGRAAEPDGPDAALLAGPRRAPVDRDRASRVDRPARRAGPRLPPARRHRHGRGPERRRRATSAARRSTTSPRRCSGRWAPASPPTATGACSFEAFTDEFAAAQPYSEVDADGRSAAQPPVDGDDDGRRGHTPACAPSATSRVAVA